MRLRGHERTGTMLRITRTDTDGKKSSSSRSGSLSLGPRTLHPSGRKLGALNLNANLLLISGEWYESIAPAKVHSH